MNRPMTDAAPLTAIVGTGRRLIERLPALTKFAMTGGPHPLSRRPEWLTILANGLDHQPYALEVVVQNRTFGFLPLAFVESRLFGRFLVSLPYLNSNGVIAQSPDVAKVLLDRAVALAEELNANHVELRHETAIGHAAFPGLLTSKVQMRLSLPGNVEKLWKGFDSKLRNQIRKGEKSNFALSWGGLDQLDAFYDVLSRNMRDLGTPIFSRRLFESILTIFPRDAELCILRDGSKPIAGALLLHGPGVTEVPSASSLRDYNSSCVNMVLYARLLERAAERRQAIFDFGRSTTDGPTFNFKKQWGAKPSPTAWQFHLRAGPAGEMRPDNPRYQQVIRLWQRLPVKLTQLIGPTIVRGIP